MKLILKLLIYLDFNLKEIRDSVWGYIYDM